MARTNRGRYLARLRMEQLESRWLLDGSTFYVDDDGPNDPGPGDSLVSDPLEDGSSEHPFDALQEAIDSGMVTDGDTIVLNAGTYTGPGNHDISLRGKAITVRSTDPSDSGVVEATVIDALGTNGENHRVFYINGGETSTTKIAGLTLTGGYVGNGGAVLLRTASPTIEYCRFIGNETIYSGGAIFVDQGADSVAVTLRYNTFSGNVAGQHGGAVYGDGASFVFTETTISENTAGNHGGGVYVKNATSLNMARNTIADNTASGEGGGFYAAYCETMTFSDNTVAGNASTGVGGGFRLYDGIATLEDNTFEENTAASNGGAMEAALLDEISLSDNWFIENTSTGGSGGGIMLSSVSRAELSGNLFDSNTCYSAGGGIDVYGSIATIENCRIEGNTASNGAGISLRNYSQAEIRGNRILGNVAEDGDGGGARVDYSSAFFEGNLIADNVTKTGYGGGVDCHYASPMFRRNVFLNNYAPHSGTQLASHFGSPTLANNTLYIDDPSISEELAQVYARGRSMPLVVNTIIWGTGPSFENSERVHLFYSNTSDGPLFPADGNIAETPAFVDAEHPLGADYEFNTDDDGFRLLPGSLCIDAGHPAFLDGDGTRSDIGAYGDAFASVDLSDIYVDGTNTAGPWDGSSTQPYLHIWEAVLAADDGDTIHVAAGYYEENLVFRSDKPNLTIIGAGAETTVLDGTRRDKDAGVTEAWFVDNLEVRGLTLQHGLAGHGGAMRIVGSSVGLFENTIQDCTAYDGGGVYVDFNSQMTIDGNAFLRNTARWGGAVQWAESCSGSILNNIIAENRAAYSGRGDGGGLWIAGSPTISGNTIVNNVADEHGGGIRCRTHSAPTIDHNVIARNSASFGGGISAQIAGPGTLLLNNTIADNTAVSGGGLYANRGQLEVVNTIFWGNAADVGPQISIFAKSNDTDIRYSIVQGGKSGIYADAVSTLTWGPGMIYANPLFAPGADDYHLKSTVGRWDPSAVGGAGAWVTDDVCSPGIDRGQPDPDTTDPVDEPYWDWKLETDPNGERINMGAYGGTVEASRSCDCAGDPPVVTLTDPAPGSAESVCAGIIQVWFDRDMLPSTVEMPSNWQVVGSGGDGLFFDEGEGENNDVYWPVLEVLYEGDGAPAELLVSDLPCGCLPADVYRLTARDGLLSIGLVQLDGEFPEEGTVADFPSGDGAAGGDFTATFEVTNAPPMAIPGHATVLQDSEDNLLTLEGCDADGDPLEFEICWDDPANPGRIEHGWLDPGTDDLSETWYYTPDEGYSGPDEFDFRAFDGQDYSACTLFTIEVIPTPCDLEPTRFEVTEEGYTGECLCPGTSITLQWDAINNGPGETVDLSPTDWTDRIYLSSDATLDGSDQLLHSSGIVRSEPLAVGGSYSMEAVVALPDDLPTDGGYYLILHVDDDNTQLESDDDNNFAVIPFCIKPFVHLELPFCGIFVDPGDPFEIAWEDSAEGIEAFVNVVLDDDTDPDNGHLGFLVEGQPEDPDGDGDSVVVQTPEIDPGTYYAYAWLSDAEGVRLSCPSGVIFINVFETAEITLDPLGDIAAGLPADYEIYSIETGRNGDEITFRIRTDYDPRVLGGDVYLELGSTIAALATADRTLPNGQEVIAGDLYLGVEFAPGEIVPLPHQIESWTEHIAGQSRIWVIDDVACMDAEFALFGWFMLAALPGGGGQLGWTMWCGNDVVTAGLPGPPSVTDVYVGSTEWTPEFLRALEGPGVGTYELGYRIPGGTEQAASLPWSNLDQVSVVFSEPVDVTAGDFDIYGHTDFPIEIAEFAYDPETFTATWTLALPLEMDEMRVNLSDGIEDMDGNSLDGEWEEEILFRSGDGTAGGLFEFAFNVVPGDANRDGTVASGDLDCIRAHWGEAVVAETVPWGATADEDILRSHWNQSLPPDETLFADLDGDGFIRSSDLDVIRAHWCQHPPTAAAIADGNQQNTAPLVGPIENPQRDATDAAFAELGSTGNATTRTMLAEATWAYELQQRSTRAQSKDKMHSTVLTDHLFAEVTI